MTGLPKSIIKKYGVTKRAWQVFRGYKSHSKSKKRGFSTMAKRKRKYHRGGRSSSMNWKKLVVAGAIYGVAREPVANALSSVVINKLPFGAYNDEAVMGAISYLLAWKGKGYVKEIGEAGLVIEVARLLSGISSGALSSSSGVSSGLGSPTIL